MNKYFITKEELLEAIIDSLVDFARMQRNNKKQNTSRDWYIYDQEGNKIKMNNLEYLNHLLEKSRSAIKIFNKIAISFVLSDLEELKDEEPNFYRMHMYAVDGEISTLRRLSSLTKIRSEKTGIRA